MFKPFVTHARDEAGKGNFGASLRIFLCHAAESAQVKPINPSS
jgi:hypothetical protein